MRKEILVKSGLGAVGGAVLLGAGVLADRLFLNPGPVGADGGAVKTPTPVVTPGAFATVTPDGVRLAARADTATAVPAATVKPTEVPAAVDFRTSELLSQINQRLTSLEEKKSPTATAKSAETVQPFGIVSTGAMPGFVSDLSHGAWLIRGTDRLRDNPIIEGWLKRLKDPDPKNWPTFPNVPNPKDPSFRVVNGSEVPDGMEYGVANVPFFEQDRRGDFVVPARHYRLITADYGFQGESCINTDATNRRGCILLLINEGNETYIWRNQMADNGFTVPGRYWNGDTLEVGVRGLVSHAANNMLNGQTFANPLRNEVLNAGKGTNAGANCGVSEGCPTVDVRVVVHTGSAIVAQARTIVTKDGAQAPKD